MDALALAFDTLEKPALQRQEKNPPSSVSFPGADQQSLTLRLLRTRDPLFHCEWLMGMAAFEENSVPPAKRRQRKLFETAFRDRYRANDVDATMLISSSRTKRPEFNFPSFVKEDPEATTNTRKWRSFETQLNAHLRNTCHLTIIARRCPSP